MGSGGPDDNDAQAGRLIVAHALTAAGHDASEDGTGRGTPLVAAPLSHGSNPNSNAAGRRREDDMNVIAFNASGGGGAKDLQPTENIANPVTGSNGDPGAIAYALRKDPGGTGQGHNTNYVPATSGVRRLTPTECERLQALPDGWTQLGNTADSPRYAALGDAVTATVAEWLGRRIRGAA